MCPYLVYKDAPYVCSVCVLREGACVYRGRGRGRERVTGDKERESERRSDEEKRDKKEK